MNSSIQVPSAQSTDRVSYLIDKTDVIVSVGDSWSHFAEANGAVHLVTGVIGRPLWSFVTGLTTQHVYRELLSRVRRGQPATFTYRCDAPAVRRFMRMTMMPGEHGSVTFDSIVERTESRPPIITLASASHGADPGLRMCSWCKLVEVQESWVEIEIAVERLGLLTVSEPPLITHTMCPPCFARFTADAGPSTESAPDLAAP